MIAGYPHGFAHSAGHEGTRTMTTAQKKLLRTLMNKFSDRHVMHAGEKMACQVVASRSSKPNSYGRSSQYRLNITSLRYHLIYYHHIIIIYHHISILAGGLEHVLFSHILGIMIPTDFHIFQRGRYLAYLSSLPMRTRHLPANRQARMKSKPFAWRVSDRK